MSPDGSLIVFINRNGQLHFVSAKVWKYLRYIALSKISFSFSQRNWLILHNFLVISTVSHFDRTVKLCSPAEVNIPFLSMNVPLPRLLIRWRYCHSIRCASSSGNPSFHWWWKLFNNEHVCFIQSTIFCYRVLSLRKISSCNNRYSSSFSQKSGIVNVYSYDDVMKTNAPKPIKYLKNLTTSIQNVKMNASSELLAMNSYHLPRAVRLVS